MNRHPDGSAKVQAGAAVTEQIVPNNNYNLKRSWPKVLGESGRYE
jgi:hypothetical protein